MKIKRFNESFIKGMEEDVNSDIVEIFKQFVDSNHEQFTYKDLYNSFIFDNRSRRNLPIFIEEYKYEITKTLKFKNTFDALSPDDIRSISDLLERLENISDDMSKLIANDRIEFSFKINMKQDTKCDKIEEMISKCDEWQSEVFFIRAGVGEAIFHGYEKYMKELYLLLSEDNSEKYKRFDKYPTGSISSNRKLQNRSGNEEEFTFVLREGGPYQLYLELHCASSDLLPVFYKRVKTVNDY